MKWFEEHNEQKVGSDSEAPGNSYKAIAEIADEALDGQTMIRFVQDWFGFQKLFGEFLGVGESTVAGWMKNSSFPDYAKRAGLAAYYASKYFRQLKEAKRDASRPKVVRDGDRYMIVRFEVDEAGVAIGEVLAKDIPTEKAALVFAGSMRAWELLGETEELIDGEIDIRGPEGSEWIQDLKDEIGLERTRTFAHEKLCEIERDKREFIDSPGLEIRLSSEDKAKTDNAAEGEVRDD
jgi:transcriptional regulator with XRE-family HTH domain